MQDLAAVLSQKRGLTKAQAEVFVSSMFDVVNYGLDTERLVKVKGLGTFKVTNVKDRESINVNTGERVVISGHGKISFTPEIVLREMVNKPFSQFETVVLNDGVDFSQIDNASGFMSDEPSDESGETQDPPSKAEASQPIAPRGECSEKPVSAVGDGPVLTTDDAETERATKEDEKEVSEGMEPISAEEMDILQAETVVAADAKLTAGASENAEDTVGTPNSAAVQTVLQPQHSSVKPPEEKREQPADRVEKVAKKEDEEEIGKSSSVWKPIIIGVVVLLLAVFAGFVGYYLGIRSLPSEVVEKQTPVKVGVPKVNRKHVKEVAKKTQQDTTMPVENVGVSTTAETDVKNKQPETNNKPSEVSEKKNDKERNAVKTESSVASKYDQMDVRVRTGAYAIVGVDQIVMVKQGETLKSLSDRYLGTGMECYVEALNGKRSVSAGETLKIPKLQLKKRLKK